MGALFVGLFEMTDNFIAVEEMSKCMGIIIIANIISFIRKCETIVFEQCLSIFKCSSIHIYQ